MRSFRKIFISIFAVLLLTGCNALAGYSRAMSFQVNTGDSVRVECTKESGYSIAKSDNGFTVEQKGVVVAYGNFLTREMYDGLLASSKAPNVTILAEDENYCRFNLKTANGSGYYYLVWLDMGKGTGVGLTSIESEEDFDRVVENISFKLNK